MEVMGLMLGEFVDDYTVSTSTVLADARSLWLMSLPCLSPVQLSL